MQLRHLRYFVKIVEAGSFSRAAALIPVAQPALSQQIAALEEELGVVLLHRSARGARPTAAGAAFYTEAASILSRMERIPQIVRSLDGEIQGVVRIGMSSTLASFLAGELMEKCRAVLPKISLRFSSDASGQLGARIRDSSLDLALVFEDQPTTGFAREPLFRQRLFVVSPCKPGRRLSALRFERLADMPLILPAHPNITRGMLDRLFSEAGIVPQVVAETEVFSGMLSAVQAGIGHTILPRGDFSGLPGRAMVSAALIEPPVYLTAAVIASADVPLAPPAEAVRGLLSDVVMQQVREKGLAGAELLTP
ncbi:LysR substrate-binding domain-containing protein [Achromobacter sp. NFACC18-2]|uniref:LysR substrate-binding domain-containing protein n=1 Tax=Achromobacter sp. NFACC18-2 TaxID=1564112 RepID=UPI0008CE4FD8|nr:LysR substrate-binding domain-containing protein [Achromobacter sp. NFACC18-2]SEI80829.1 LysR family transcriptional regulator, nitrogen assimilation regulatory protein [Achromobacter sp. NFACC18-2]